MSDVVVIWLRVTAWVVLVYGLVLNTQYLVLLVLANRRIRASRRRDRLAGHDDLFANPLTPGISIIVPAHDEELGIVDSVLAVLSLRYPQIEAVVVDDGSTDGTFPALERAFDLVAVPLVPNERIRPRGEVFATFRSATRPVTVVRKESVGSKADATNGGLSVARHPLVCVIDADSILDEDALLRMVQPFVDDPDRVIGTGGSVRVVNDSVVDRGRLAHPSLPRSWSSRIQIIEYLRAFLLGRTGWSELSALLIVSGAFGLFRRDALEAVGGYDPSAIGEDMDLVVRLHRYYCEQQSDYRIVFVPEPACWTEVPGTMGDLRKQRRRWSRGLAQIISTQRRMIGNPRYGRVGVLAVPHFVAFELLGPVVELGGLLTVLIGLALGLVSVPFAALIALAAFGYGLTLSVASLAIETTSYHRHDHWRVAPTVLVASVLETIGFRQIHAWWRLEGLYRSMRGQPFVWEPLPRSGFARGEADEPTAVGGPAGPATAADADREYAGTAP